MREHMAARGTGPVPVRRRVLVAIDGLDNSEYLVRVTRKIAERRQAPWTVVFVDGGHFDAERQRTVEAVLRTGAPARRRWRAAARHVDRR